MGRPCRTFLAGALVAALGLVTGCGGGDDEASGSTTIATTSSSSTSTSSRSSTTTATSTSEAGAEPVPVDPTWGLEEDTWMVWGVEADDVLNVRAEAGPSAPVVATLAPGASGIRRFTVTRRVGEGTWSAIEVQGGAGWVNDRFLRPEPAAAPTVHGQLDGSLADAGRRVRDALQAGERSALAELAHPDGVTFSTEAYVGPESPTLSRAQLLAADQDATQVLWGYTDGEGAPIRQTIDERLESIAGSTALTSTTDIGFDERVGLSNTVDNLTETFPGARVVEYHHDGTGEEAAFNWQSVRFVFDSSSGEPLLVAVVQDTWTI